MFSFNACRSPSNAQARGILWHFSPSCWGHLKPLQILLTYIKTKVYEDLSIFIYLLFLVIPVVNNRLCWPTYIKSFEKQEWDVSSNFYWYMSFKFSFTRWWTRSQWVIDLIHKLIHHPITYSCIFFNLQNTCYDKAWCCLTDGLVTVYVNSSLIWLSWFQYIICQNHRMKFLGQRLYFLKIQAPQDS